MPIAKEKSKINLKEMLYLQELNVGIYGVTLYTDYNVEDDNIVTDEIDGTKLYTRQWTRTFNNHPMIFGRQQLNFENNDLENNVFNFSNQFFFIEAVSKLLLAISYSSDVNQYFKLQALFSKLDLYSRLKLLKNEFEVDTKEANQLLEVRNQLFHMISPSLIQFCNRHYKIYEDELWNQIAGKFEKAVITLGTSISNYNSDFHLIRNYE
jgi:hypothetical protein